MSAEHWYAIYTRAGTEDKLRNILYHRIESPKLLLPQREIIVVRRERKQKISKPIFPGYLFIYSELDKYTHLEVLKTPGVIRIVGVGNKPLPIPDWEMEPILALTQKSETIKPYVVLAKGDLVEIIDGPLMGFVGEVLEINLEKERLRILLSLFNQPRVVELSCLDVRKYDELWH